MKTSIIIFLFGVPLAAMTFLGACSKQKDSAADLADLRNRKLEIEQQIKDLEIQLGDSAEVLTHPVTVYMAQPMPFSKYLEVRGVVDSKSTINISPRINGIVSSVLVSNGDAVQRGQLLFEIDAEVLRRTLDEVETQLEFAETVFQKQKRIWEQKAGSEIQYLQAKTSAESLTKRKASLLEQISMARVTAPTTGIVDNLTVKAGENVIPGMSAMSIVNTSDMRVIVDVAETYASSVQKGAKARVVIHDLADTLETVVGNIGRNINPVDRTVRLELPIRSRVAGLRPNMTARVSIHEKTMTDVISIPLDAIQRRKDMIYVFAVNRSGVAEKRNVQLGVTNGTHVQVVEGIAANDKIIRRGANTLVDGQPVRIIQ